MSLHDISVSSLPKTAARSINKLKLLNVHTMLDLIQYFPYRYEDYSKIIPIAHIPQYIRESLIDENEEYNLISRGKVSIQGTVEKFTNIVTPRRFKLQKVRVRDDSGKTELTWFNQQYLRSILKEGSFVTVSGFVREQNGFIQFQPEEYEVGDSSEHKNVHTGRLIPVYRQTRGISSKTIRQKIAYALGQYESLIEDMLPEEIIKLTKSMNAIEAYKHIHSPQTEKELKKARSRLALDEMFTIQLTSQLIKKEWNKENVGNIINVKVHENQVDTFINSLPFKLTSAQERVNKEILQDLTNKHPMNRLLQGDVGSGKTIVAATAAYATHLSGLKTILMAPTEILAKQHYEGLQQTFNALKKVERPQISLVTAKSKPTKQELDESSIIIGTHALISKKAIFSKVGLAVIDEQHKFGVVQRAQLKEKGQNPHMLSMTATPIPRTVTLTIYGELDISIIDELPKGRKKIKTYPVETKKRNDAYEWIKKEINTNQAQVFVVCPIIEESSAETMKSVKAASVEYESLKKIFAEHSVGLLHGKQKVTEKDEVMKNFSSHVSDILVATPVVEVGIDIPDATIIIIEAAERFGLAQLHQLRGRVGRSDKQSYCLLFTEKPSSEINQRLKYFSSTQDGFKLAEYDLEHRGAGNMYGTQQHGVSDLVLASITDSKLIQTSQKAVNHFIDKNIPVEKYPELERRLEKYRIKHIAKN